MVYHHPTFYNFDLTFSIISLRRIFPETDFGTELTNVTLLSLLYGAT